MLLGTKLQNYTMLHQAISEGNLREEIISMSSDGNVFAFPDGKVWMFQEYQLKDRELAGYRQAIALDVSEIYYNSERIKFNNEKLETLNQQLEEMYEKIGERIRKQENIGNEKCRCMIILGAACLQYEEFWKIKKIQKIPFLLINNWIC